ncbi:hypothetical protein RB195_009007 [Necator americanus]|uniref:ABC transporter family G domain-containing protein n=1 Tax=Necator americanus TaxID=51031 RepID=A0ABR1CRF9_NECAM
MGLSGCADTMIGIPNSVKGLSCGEMKRLAFASEILTCPKILFCDEPTSGLDAFMAGHVVAALRSLADGGMTVVITIHQPSSQVYSMFNDVCLMACGRIIYLGPAEEAEPLFESCGYPSPEYYNPADHLIRTLAIINGEKSTCLKTISRIRQGFLQTPYGKEVLEISNGQINETKRQISEEINNSGKDHSFFNMKSCAEHLDIPVRDTHKRSSVECGYFNISTDVAMTFLPIFVVPMLAFGGFFITYDAIPGYFTWLSKLSYFKYGYEALAINEWDSVDFIPGCLNNSLKYVDCPKSGAEVLDQIDFDGFNKWMDVLILSGMFVLLRLIAYGALLIRAYRNH